MVPLSHFSVLAFLYSIQLFVQPSLCTREHTFKRPPAHDAPYQLHYVRPTYATASKNPNHLRNTTLLLQSTNDSSEDESLAEFGQVIPVLGDMERTDQNFVDGPALDLFTPSNRTVVVTQNFSPLPAAFVQGSSGGPFVPVSNYSHVIKMSDTTPNLIAKFELPCDPAALEAQGLDPSNTYVSTLDSAGNAWTVQRSVHVTENKTRINKSASNIFLQHGDGATRTFNITGGGAVAVGLLGSGPGVVLAGLGKLDGEDVVLEAEKPRRGDGAQQARMASGAVVPRTGRVLVGWQLAAVALCMFLK